MAQSDFNYLPINHTFTANSPVFDLDFPVEVGAGHTVVDDGYLVITVRSADSQNHRIRINNVDLTGFDIPLPPANSDAWLTYMDRIQPNVLHPGTNHIQIMRVGNDDFVVKDMVVHWREQ